LEFAAVGVMGLVIARQSLAIHENRTTVNEERRSLIASVSHELRTPLTSMIGFLTVLKESGDDLDPLEQAELSDVVLEQANYMGRMVTDMVLLARDTPQKLNLIERDISVGQLVSSTLNSLGTDAGRINMEVETDVPIRVDDDRIRQIISNLLTNAIRYGADQYLLRVVAESDDLVIEVHDNGPGVPKKYQRSIWERFDRGTNQLNSAVPGTGLGLPIVALIARAHGGTATYRESLKLGGACFSVILPGAVSHTNQVQALDPEISQPSPPVSARSQ
jgi:signal transduction histidine kinase